VIHAEKCPVSESFYKVVKVEFKNFLLHVLSGAMGVLPLVSVIVPTRNSAQFLERCLASIRNQSYANVEVIAVDNYSSDGTPEIARKYADGFYQNDLNKPVARNFGADKSKGDFLFFSDADMVLKEDVINDAVNACISKNLDGLVIPEIVKSSGLFSNARKMEKNIYINDTKVEALRFITRQVYDEINGFDEEFNEIDEYAFDARVRLKKFKVGNINSFITVYEKFSLIKNLRGKFNRGRELKNFKQRYPKDSKRRFSSKRIGSYVKKWRTLILNPVTTLLLIFLKSSEVLCFYFGSLFPKRFSNISVMKKFDSEAEFYEKEMYKKTIGSRYVDRIERKIVMDELKNLTNYSFLDLGCGNGRWSGELIKRGNYVVGLDISPEMLKVCRKKIKSKRFSTVESDMENLLFEDNTFDGVVCIRAIKYAKNYRNVIKEVHRISKPNSLFILEVPNFYQYFIPKFLSRIFKNNGYFSYIRLFKLKEIEKTFKEEGFNVMKIEPMFFVPHVLYGKADSKLTFNLVKWLERIISLFPKNIVSRSFLVVGKKM